MPEAATGGVRKKVCSSKFWKIHRKTPVRVSLFFVSFFLGQPATLLKKRLWQRRFPVNLENFYERLLYRRPPGVCF